LVGAAVSIEANPEQADAAATARTASIGFRFPGMLDDPPGRVETSATELWASKVRSVAILAMVRAVASTVRARDQIGERSPCHGTGGAISPTRLARARVTSVEDSP
jgi:hypothetical protein